MILLRQKEYTRAEREALKELLFKTGKLRRLPGGSKMTARDVARFNKLAADVQLWTKGYKPKKEDFKSAKVFLEHAGLGKSAEELEHIASKYSNREVLSRWQRLRQRHSEFDIPGISSKQLKRLNKRYDIDRKNCHKVLTDLGSLERGEGSLIANLAEDAKKKNIPIIQNLGEPSESFTESLNYTRKLAGRDNVEGILKSIKYDTPEFSTKQAKRLESAVKNKNVDNIVVIGKSTGPGILAHELGHCKTLDTSSSGRYLDLAGKAEDRVLRVLSRKNDTPHLFYLHNRARQIGDSLGEIANESSATSYGLARLKKHGSTSKQLKKMKDELGLNGALGTYVNKNRKKIAESYLNE